MVIFDPFRRQDINHDVKICRNDPDAVLLDVRSPQEYRQGHIPGSRNIPLAHLEDVEDVVENKEGALYVYCYSGARSGQAAALLRRMGYTNVHNIGGIAAYHGPVDRQ